MLNLTSGFQGPVPRTVTSTSEPVQWTALLKANAPRVLPSAHRYLSFHGLLRGAPQIHGLTAQICRPQAQHRQWGPTVPAEMTPPSHRTGRAAWHPSFPHIQPYPPRTAPRPSARVLTVAQHARLPVGCSCGSPGLLTGTEDLCSLNSHAEILAAQLSSPSTMSSQLHVWPVGEFPSCLRLITVLL